MDERYQKNKITTHNGASIEAQLVVSGNDILSIVKSLKEVPDVVAVDEAFMIDGSAAALCELFKSGISVYVASIQLSATGKEFTEVRDMMPWATEINVCSAVCESTGHDAYYTVRISAPGEEIEIGGAETYQPRSWTATPFMKK